MEGLVLQVLLVVVSMLIGCIILKNRRFQLPPGPLSLPIIGTAWRLRGPDVREAMLSLARQYGDVFTMHLGGATMVILASYDVIREAYVKNGALSSGRALANIGFRAFATDKSPLMIDGEVWREQKRLLVKVFREHGLGKSGSEGRIIEEARHLLQELLSHEGKDYNPGPLLQKAVSNVINQLVFGQRFPYTDPRFIRDIKVLDEALSISGNGGPLALFPWLRYLPGDLFKYKRILHLRRVLETDFQKCIDEHREAKDQKAMDDFIGAFLQEMERHRDNPESSFTDEQMMAMVKGLFVAGTESTATTLRWAIIYMINYPDVMIQVQKEIDDVIGASRMPSMSDMPSMSYTQAVLLEVQRIVDITPFGIPHKATADMRIGSYVIPSGTRLMAIHHAVHRDAKLWKDPYDFNPGHFLDEQGNVQKSEYIMSFGLGPRMCTGRSLAEMELFLYFVALLQQFDLYCPPGCPPPEKEGDLGILHIAKPFKVVFKQRQ